MDPASAREPVGLIDRGATRGRGAQAAGLMAIGLVVALRLPGAPVWAWAALAGSGLLLALVGTRRLSAAGLSLAVASCGGAWMAARVWSEDVAISRTRAALPESDESGGVLVRATGIVVGAPRVRDLSEAWWKLRDDLAAPRVALVRLSLRTLGPADGRPDRPAAGCLWLAVTPASMASGWRAGDRIEVVGRARGVEGPTLPGQRDPRLTATQDGVVGFMSVQGEAAARRSSRESASESPAERAGWWLRRQIDALRGAARGVLDGPADRASARFADTRERQGESLIRALLLGDDDAALGPVVESWGRLGLLHALSISGFHIAVMAGLALTIVRFTGDRGHLEPLVALVMLAAYLLIVPAEAPVLRSGISIGVVLLAETLGRRYDRLSVLGFAAVGLLLWRPLDVIDPGFQLSFVLTGVLLVLGAPVHRWMTTPRGVRGRVRRRVGPAGLAARAVWKSVTAMLSTSVLAWAVATPIVAFHFGLFSPLTVIAGALVVPIIVPVLWLGYLTLLVGAVWPTGASWCVDVLSALGRVLVDLTAWLDAWPLAGVPLPAIPWWLAAMGVAAALAVFVRRRVRDPWPWAAVGLTLAITGWTVVRAWRGTDELRIDPIRIRDGSCTLVRQGGAAVLVDAGSTRRSVVHRAAREIPGAVRALGGWRVPVLVLAHADASAWSMAPALVRPLGVRRVLVAPRLWALAAGRAGSPEGELLSRLRGRGVEVEPTRAGERVDLGGGVWLQLWEDARGELRAAVQREGGAPMSWIPSSDEPAK